MRRANTKSLSNLVRGNLACVCLGLTSLSNALANVDICQDPATYSRLSIDIVRHSDSTFDNGAGTIGQKNNNFDLMFKTDDDKWLVGAGHRYSIFDIDPLQPETNGHLHTFFLPLHKLTGNDDRSFRASIAPALSASSNVFDNRKVTSDAVQLLAALVWGRRLSDRMSLRYGICGDHRFGDYQIYPLISVQWQLHPDWNVQLGFPASQLTYQISKRLRSMIRITPDGNEWYVLDKSLASQTQFVYESYALEWTFDWELRESLMITASVGRQIHNRFEMTLLDQSRVRLSSDSVNRLGAALEWRF
jgi:hypothetical protein